MMYIETKNAPLGLGAKCEIRQLLTNSWLQFIQTAALSTTSLVRRNDLSNLTDFSDFPREKQRKI